MEAIAISVSERRKLKLREVNSDMPQVSQPGEAEPVFSSGLTKSDVITLNQGGLPESPGQEFLALAKARLVRAGSAQ